MIRSRAKNHLAEHLPANKVLWVLIVQATVVIPHVTHLPSWILIAILSAGIWRYHATRRQWRAPTLVLRTLLIGIGSVAVYANYGTLFGRDAGVAMIILMLGLKLLELNRRRDVVVFILLGYFLVITNFLYSQTVPMALYMVTVGVLLTSALAAVSDPGWRVRPAHHVRLAATLLLQALPIALLLFLLFPRVSGPLWGLPEDAFAGATGLSERMTPGTISRLARSHEAAFRVEFFDQAPATPLMYWRGPVMDHYDGRSWSSAHRVRGSAAPRQTTGRLVDYQVTLEPNGHSWLLALDIPVSAPADATLSSSYEVLANGAVRERTRYRIRSRIQRGQGIGVTLSAAERRRALQLPRDSEPGTRALGQELAATHQDPRAIADAALQRFHQQPYVYTLNPPLLGGKNPIDQFLFGTRKGFCEHYAGAFVALMRAAGVPARVITGYQGGEFNPTGAYWIIRQSDAHAWAEVWLPEDGWVRMDPTAAVAPQRIEGGIDAALPEQMRRVGFQHIELTMLHDIGLLWDSVNNRWNQWVLGYGANRQSVLLQELGFGRPEWLDLALLAAVAVTAALLLIVASMALRHRIPVDPPALRAYKTFCAKLARVGFVRHPSEGPMDFAQRVIDGRSDLEAEVHTISRLYAQTRYGPHGHELQLERLKRLIRNFAPDKRADL